MRRKVEESTRVSENKTVHLSSVNIHACIHSGSPFNLFIFSFLVFSVLSLSLCIDHLSFIFIWDWPLQLPPFSLCFRVPWCLYFIKLHKHNISFCTKYSKCSGGLVLHINEVMRTE